MRHLSVLLNGLAKSLYSSGGSSRGRKFQLEDDGGKEAADTLLKDAKKNDLILKSTGYVGGDGGNGFISVFSQRGEKGVNQDCSLVWQVSTIYSSC